MKRLTGLRARHWAVLTGLFAALYGFAVTQRYWIPEAGRPFSLLAAVVAALLLFFALVRPEEPYALSRLLALALGAAAAALVLLLHFVIAFEPSYKNAVVVAVAALSPFASGFLYSLIARR